LKRFRVRPTYSNVVATLALFFALAGGAWAATQLPKESVGSTQLKNGAVTPAKLSDAAKKGMTGARGEAGAQGALGPRGNEGPRGENGTAGATGPQGVRGATGAIGAAGSRGEAGEIGLRGERGVQGETGMTGLRGEQGERGNRGFQGVQGEPGDPGEPGEPGEKGDPGPIGPSDAYIAISENAPFEVEDGLEGLPLELALPAGEYVLQAALTIEGKSGGDATAECAFKPGSAGIAFGPSNKFLAGVAASGFASLVGTTTATLSEDATIFVLCTAVEKEAAFVIPAKAGHLTATKVGALHP